MNMYMCMKIIYTIRILEYVDAISYLLPLNQLYTYSYKHKYV